MTSLLGTLILWTVALWALGWLTLPLSRRVFAGLPDGGLAAGRVAFVVLVALVAFWGASLHLVPLRLAPGLAIGVMAAGMVGWHNDQVRVWARQNWRSLALSDAIFLASWALFLWVRLRHPELGDLEKPMDAALLSAAWKSDWLPFAHPWWGGADFTNYYYFGPLMGALMGRALGAPPHLAPNLVQPAFCAFFLSTLWPLGAALTRSKWWGLAVVMLVGWSGPLEPLRQIAAKGPHWPLDWFSTSRVIENTINEYPAFTMTIGDAHAHFYALSFAALWLCLAWSLFAVGEAEAEMPSQPPPANRAKGKRASKANAARQAADKAAAEQAAWGERSSAGSRRLVVIVGGLVLGAWLMCNTWDSPVFGLLFGLAIWLSRPSNQPKTRAALWVVAPFVVAVPAAALYFWKFKSPVGGAKFDPWLPDAFSFALLWGGFILAGAGALALPATARDEAARFRRLLIGAGLVALVAPFIFYIKDAFDGGDFRHINTVFKFGLQAWILLGLGIGAELGARAGALGKTPELVVALALLLVAPLLVLAPATTIWTRAEVGGARALSLNGMSYLPIAQQRALVWLQQNGRAGDIVMEPVPLNDDGSPGGDYDGNWGVVGAFSGLSSTLGWPQHVWGWDGNAGEVMERGRQIAALYALPSALDTARGASPLDARFVYFGAGNWQTPDGAEARAAGFAVHAFEGEDGSRALILERIGR